MTSKVYSVCTTAQIDCTASRAWSKVCFYEHIEVPATWLLRTVLPVPQRTSGAYRAVGDVSRCLYSDGGYLAKRIRAIGGMGVEFDVIEQSIRYAARIQLRGGTIRAEPAGTDACRVHMVTDYSLRSRWLSPARFAIEHVIGAMHRIVLADMRASLARDVGERWRAGSEEPRLRERSAARPEHEASTQRAHRLAHRVAALRSHSTTSFGDSDILE